LGRDERAAAIGREASGGDAADATPERDGSGARTAAGGGSGGARTSEVGGVEGTATATASAVGTRREAGGRPDSTAFGALAGLTLAGAAGLRESTTNPAIPAIAATRMPTRSGESLEGFVSPGGAPVTRSVPHAAVVGGVRERETGEGVREAETGVREGAATGEPDDPLGSVEGDDAPRGRESE